MSSPPSIAPGERSFSTRSCRLPRVLAMRPARRATCHRVATWAQCATEINIVDKLENGDLEMIGNVDRTPRAVNFMVGSIDPAHLEPCGLMWDGRCAQHGAQLAGWARKEVQPGHRCRGAALRGMPNRHEIRNHLHVSRPVSRLDARVSDRGGMTVCGYPLPPRDGVAVTSPLWGSQR